MKNVKREVLWGTLTLISLLTAFSVYGAFLGAKDAKIFFNSIPLAVYWSLFLGLLVVGFVAFKRLIRVPALLLIHAGCLAILIGGMWGSSKGQSIQKEVFGREFIGSGYVIAFPGQQTNQVQVGEDDNMQIKELPFVVAVDDFRIEYYDPEGELFIGAPSAQQQWTMKDTPNTSMDLGAQFGSVKVVNIFKDCRISIGQNGGETTAYDVPGKGYNPAVELLVTPPGGGEPKTRYIFEQNPGHASQGSPLAFQYRRHRRSVSDYISDVRILAKSGDQDCVTQKAIEVNHPLYYGGYHFYQSSYFQDRGRTYTVLSVTHVTGLAWVFGGFLLMCLGISWQCWFVDIRKVLKQEAL
ncbi:MAG: cytochrome c biogenesis protein ResB [Phycisphaeraceae bacterium]|nr:cytochrome c biogenesis protein ResB [Phycisphaeraceae bacterium]